MLESGNVELRVVGGLQGRRPIKALDQMTAKPATKRMEELRTRRKALGLSRLELYAHKDDHEAIRRYAATKALKREREKEQKK